MTSTIVRYGLMALVVAMTVSLVAAAPVLAGTPEGTFDGDSSDGADDGSSWSDGSLLTDSTNSSDGTDDSDGSRDSSDGTDDGSASDDSTDRSDTSTSGESDGDDGSSRDAGGSDDVRSFADQLTEPADATVAATDRIRTRSVLSVDTLDAALFAEGDGPDDTADDVEDAADTVESTAGGAVSDLESTTDTVVRSLTGETDSVLGTTTVSEPPRTRADVAAGQGVDADRSFAGPSTNVPGHDGGEGLPPGPTSGLAVGLGAVAVGAAVRKGALAPGIAANLGSALSTAGLAPVVGRSGLLDRLVRALAPLRYSRYDDSDPLEHEARSDVYEIVEATPGAYLSEVADRAELPLSTARHHVRVLEREDLVSGAKVRGKRRFYPAYTNGLELAAAMNDDATASVLDAIARLGAASVSDLASDLGRDPSTISHHLQRLEEDGIIVRERDGRAVMNKLSPDARTALVPESGEAGVAEAGEAMASD